MRGPFLLRTPSAGLQPGRGAVPGELRRPAGPRRAGGKPQGVSSVDGANVEFAAFQNSAFPYHGLIPNYQETGKTRPFLDVDDNGRLGHSSPRGGLCGRIRPITTAPSCSPRRRISTRPARRHRRLLPRQHGDAPARCRRPPADRAPARRFGLERRPGRPAARGRRARFERRKILVAGRLRRLPQRGRGQARRILSGRARRLPPHAGRHRRL